MARWGSGDDTRWEPERDRGRWGEDRNAGRWGDERNAGRWRGDDERYFGRDEGSWRERSSGWRDDDWRSRERGDEWRGSESRSGDWRGGEGWRGREGRWEELRPGERRTYRAGGEERGEGRGFLGRIRDEGREMFGRHGDGGRWDRDRDEDWRSESWRNEDRDDRRSGLGLGGREYGGVMGGAYGTGSDRDSGRGGWRGRESGGYGGYGRSGEYGGYGSEYGLGSDYGRYESGRGDWRESREEHGGGMMDRLKEGMRKLTGKGPKGYRRSDERIREDVSERIARSAIEADDVEVKVENGEVTLSGTVNSREDKRRLEDLAEDVFGVDEVHNSLRVNRGTLRAGTTTQSSGLIGTGQPATGGGPSTGTGTSPQPTQVRTGPNQPVEPGKTAH